MIVVVSEEVQLHGRLLAVQIRLATSAQGLTQSLTMAPSLFFLRLITGNNINLIQKLYTDCCRCHGWIRPTNS